MTDTPDRLAKIKELREAASQGKLKAFRTSSGVMVLAWYDDEIRDYRVLAKFNIDQRVRNADEANAALAAQAPALAASVEALGAALQAVWDDADGNLSWTNADLVAEALATIPDLEEE